MFIVYVVHVTALHVRASNKMIIPHSAVCIRLCIVRPLDPNTLVGWKLDLTAEQSDLTVHFLSAKKHSRYFSIQNENEAKQQQKYIYRKNGRHCFQPERTKKDVATQLVSDVRSMSVCVC